jgi:subtilisin family serine protease
MRKVIGAVAVTLVAAAVAVSFGERVSGAVLPGQGVTVYVVDTGIRSDHTEFVSNVRSGFSNVNDGRGTEDCNGHGTHTAGVIGGKTYGKAPGVTLVPVRVFDCSGFAWTSNVVAGIDWVIADHVSGPAVLNISISGPLSGSFNSAVERAVADGIVVVAAAGNNNKDACGYSPGSASSAITVGAVDSSGAKWDYSNHGKCVDVVAPGVSITSAWHTSTTSTKMLKGTSQAAPHVAGVAARLLSEDPTRTVAAVTSLIVSSAPTPPAAQATTTTAVVAPSTTVAPAEMVTRSVAVPRGVFASKTPHVYTIWATSGSSKTIIATGPVAGSQVIFSITKTQSLSSRISAVFTKAG